MARCEGQEEGSELFSGQAALNTFLTLMDNNEGEYVIAALVECLVLLVS